MKFHLNTFSEIEKKFLSWYKRMNIPFYYAKLFLIMYLYSMKCNWWRDTRMCTYIKCLKLYVTKKPSLMPINVQLGQILKWYYIKMNFIVINRPYPIFYNYLIKFRRFVHKWLSPINSIHENNINHFSKLSVEASTATNVNSLVNRVCNEISSDVIYTVN